MAIVTRFVIGWFPDSESHAKPPDVWRVVIGQSQIMRSNIREKHTSPLQPELECLTPENLYFKPWLTL